MFLGMFFKCRRAGLFLSHRQTSAFTHYSLLHGAELHPDDQLRLCRHVLEDVSLQPPEHVRAQQVMKLFNLVLLGDVGKLLQEALQVAVQVTIQEEELTTGVWRLN